jgi:RNA polymerase sigma-70 factor (ECF subfamily)
MLTQLCPSEDDLAVKDDALALRIQAGDESAFELLFERYGEALSRHLGRMVQGEPGAEDTAQDLVQETFLRVWTRAEQWNGQGSFRAWFYRIATNLALNHLRSLQRHPVLPLPSEDEWSDDEETHAPSWLVDSSALGPDAALEKSEEYARLYQAINRLPEEKRQVFRLVHEMELSIRDAADRLGIPEGTVKSRLFYAQKKLTQAWRHPSEENPDDPA